LNRQPAVYFAWDQHRNETDARAGRIGSTADKGSELFNTKKGTGPINHAMARKADLDVGALVLVWTPWRVAADGSAAPAWSFAQPQTKKGPRTSRPRALLHPKRSD
jgi:hypothetical protein